MFMSVLSIAGTLMTLLGMFMFMWIFIKPKKAPMDSSNRIGHLRLVWFALTKPQDFVPLYPWLAVDEEDVLRGDYDD
jgi:hypothetical protein